MKVKVLKAGSIISSTNALALNGLGMDATLVPRTLGRECPDALSESCDPTPSVPLRPCTPSAPTSSYCEFCDAAIVHNYSQR